MAKVQALLEGHAEDVGFGECKDDQGNALPKILIFARHPATSSMAEFAKAFPPLRYIDVGLRLLVKTNVNKEGLACCEAGHSAVLLHSGIRA